MIKEYKRDWSMDFIRILSCFMVVFGHLSTQIWFNYPPDSYTWTILNFFLTFARPSIPLFVMISGYLFLKKEKLDYKTLWTKNILHLLVVYIVWVLFYAVVYPGTKRSLSDLSAIRENLLGLHPAYHLWYIRMMINIYIIIPLLWSLVHVMDKKLIRYFVIIFFVFGIIRNTIYKFSYDSTWIYQQIELFSEWLELVEYGAYFMLGYLLPDIDEFKRLSNKALVIIYLAALLAAAAVNQLASISEKTQAEYLYHSFALPVFIEAVCLFLLFHRNFSRISLSQKAGGLIKNISDSTFFIYLVHLFVINRFQIYFHIYSDSHNVIYWIPILAVVIFSLSAAAGVILKKIPIINKIVL